MPSVDTWKNGRTQGFRQRMERILPRNILTLATHIEQDFLISLLKRNPSDASTAVRPAAVKNPALPGGAFVNQEGICLRFATSCHSSPLFRAGHSGRSW